MAQFNTPATYDVERPTGTCAFTGHKLDPGKKYMATLVEIDDPEESSDKKSGAAGLGMKRLDVSIKTWQQGTRPDNLFCYWLTIMPEPNQRKKIFVDDAVLLNLFERLADSEQEQRLAFRFVLALILMRKRLLRYDGTEQRSLEGKTPKVQEWWQVTPKVDPSKGPLGRWDNQNSMQVLNPQLDESQIQQVTEQIGEILEAEL